MAEHGTDWLAPERKMPLTNAMIHAMLSAPDDTSGRGFTIDRSVYLWVSVDATFETLAETGMRKADVSKPLASTAHRKGRLTFKSVTYEIDGTPYAFLTVAQMLAQRVGYAMFLVYGSLKNDPFGEFYGSKPAKMLWRPAPQRSACRAVITMELLAGVPPSKRGETPLFGPRVGVEWHHSLLDSIFKFFLVTVLGLSEAEAAAYSMHSWRIYLACALYAAGCPNDRIQAILRWKSDEALLIYARLNDSERADWLGKARTAVVDSKVAAYLPTIDGAEVAARMLAADFGPEGADDDGDAEGGAD